jgi:hypothetical protein
MSPRWGSNTEYMRSYKNDAPLGLEYNIHTLSTIMSPRWGSDTKCNRSYKNIVPLTL